jgi:hypothetical protein
MASYGSGHDGRLARAGLAFVEPGVELRHTLYLFRLTAFVLILIGIIDKNRRSH